MKYKLHFDLSEIIGIKMFQYFDKNLDLGELEREKLYLGIMVILLNLSKLIIILLIASLLGLIKQVVIMSIELTILRLTAAGIHSKSNVMCTLISILIYVGGSYMAIEYPLKLHFVFLVTIICLFLLFMYSPADTDNRPILGEKNRKRLKSITTIVVAIFIIINLVLNNTELFNLTMICLISETVSILPCTYKLFNKSYNNYKKYELE